MTMFILKVVLPLLILLSFSPVSSQDCYIRNRVTQDGSMFYYLEPLLFYRNGPDSLSGGLVTDRENFYLLLNPFPFPPKSKNKKLSKSDLSVTLTGDKKLNLEFYDSQYMNHDSSLARLYLIKEHQMDDLRNNDIEAVQLQLQDDLPAINYHLQWHRNALRDEFLCFINHLKRTK